MYIVQDIGMSIWNRFNNIYNEQSQSNSIYIKPIQRLRRDIKINTNKIRQEE